MEDNNNNSQQTQYKKSYAREQYDKLVNNFVEQLEKGDIGSWKKSWSRPIPKSALTNGQYSGINILSLMNSEYNSNHWITKNQIDNLGGTIKEEHLEKARDIFFLKDVIKKEEITNKDTGEVEEVDKKYTVLKSYKVFNTDAVDGINFNFENEVKNQNQKIGEIENFVKNLNVKMLYGEPACSSDGTVFMPRIENFKSSEDYYNTLFHELTHFSGTPEKLNRHNELWSKYDKNKAYALEELVAELGSCFLSSKYEINMSETKNVEYLNSWISAIKEKPYILFSMASHASKSTNYLQNLAKRNEQAQNKNKSNIKSKIISPSVA